MICLTVVGGCLGLSQREVRGREKEEWLERWRGRGSVRDQWNERRVLELGDRRNKRDDDKEEEGYSNHPS